MAVAVAPSNGKLSEAYRRQQPFLSRFGLSHHMYSTRSIPISSTTLLCTPHAAANAGSSIEVVEQLTETSGAFSSLDQTVLRIFKSERPEQSFI